MNNIVEDLYNYLIIIRNNTQLIQMMSLLFIENYFKLI
jgi:hypothetical protein